MCQYGDVNKLGMGICIEAEELCYINVHPDQI